MLQIILCFFTVTLSLFAQPPYIIREPLETPRALSATVIIPCAAQHFLHLAPLLDFYSQQTRSPDEIVVSLSEIERIDTAAIDALENKSWPFRLNILRHTGKRSAGMNRNLACKASKGDLIICQDADDIPHPQRVEIVRFLFENYPIIHLMHTYFYEKPDWEFAPYCKEDINPYFFHNFDQLSSVYQDHLHNGNISFLREVSQNLHWEDVFGFDHDVKFNRDAYRLFKEGAAIDRDLILYRQRLSAFNPANIPWER